VSRILFLNRLFRSVLVPVSCFLHLLESKRDALMSLLVGCNVFVDMLESSDFVEVGKSVGDGLLVSK